MSLRHSSNLRGTAALFFVIITAAACADSGSGGAGATGGSLEQGGSSSDGGSSSAGGSPLAGGGGSTSSTGGSTPAADCPADALFCESFESGIDPARWNTIADDGAFTVDDAVPAADGAHSLHLAYGTPYNHVGQQSLEIATPISTPDDRIYLRAYMRLGDMSLPGAHPFFLDVSDQAGHELGFGSISNDFAFMGWVPGGLDNARIWYQDGGGWHPGVEDGDDTPQTENGLNAGQWFCVEIMYFGDHQSPDDTSHDAEEVRVSINGVEIPQMNASDALWQEELGHAPPEHWSPVYDKATWRFGMQSFGPDNVALDMWLDGIVLSHSPIGCGALAQP
ncbi:MAG: hypothetical protein U0271_04350 [Polyangiaceae bacterium]